MRSKCARVWSLARFRLASFLALFLFGASSVFAASPKDLKVLTLNVMCDFCSKDKERGSFEDRMVAVADTINRHDPDLVSLQEFRTRGQVMGLLARVREKYTPVFASSFLLNYPDPVLLVRESRFTVLSKDGFWLGPRSPNFDLGWKTSFPRRVEFAELQDSKSGGQLLFAGTHFDNNPRNREPSAVLVVRKFASTLLPLIFAGDTNLRPDREGYSLLAGAFRDTFLEVKSHPYVSNGPTTSVDGCNLDKGPDFPICRVDHVFLSKGSPWKTRKWSVDAFRYPGTNGFLSDHRAVVVELEHESTVR